MCPPHLQTVAAVPWEVQKVIFRQYVPLILIKWLIFFSSHVRSICHFTTVNYGPFPILKLNVESDLILPELQ